MTEYAVRNKTTDQIRMVDAPNQAGALRHVAGDEYEVTIPTRRQAMELASNGVKLEDYVPARQAKNEGQDDALASESEPAE